MQIRIATIEDVPALQDLIQESVRVLSATYYSPKQIESALQQVFGVDTQLILDQTYFIADADGQVAGAGGWSKRQKLFGGDQSKINSADSFLDPQTQPARIRAFYIHPAWSRRGVGSLVLNACEEAARAARFQEVELASTLPGVPFYLSRGYEKAEEIPINMADGEVLMTFRMTKRLVTSAGDDSE